MLSYTEKGDSRHRIGVEYLMIRKEPSLREMLDAALRETGDLNEDYISTEHLLLGITDFPDSAAAKLLMETITLPELREQLPKPGRSKKTLCTLQMTPRARKVLDIAHEVAMQSNSKEIRTEHLLAALFLEGEGLAARVLHKVGYRYTETKCSSA